MTGRWTIFSKLINPSEDPSSEIPVKTFSVDQTYELKTGYGRLFESKKKLGPRETFVAKQSADELSLAVGDNVILEYDIALLLNTIQIISGEVLPTILVKGATIEQLEDE